MYQVLKNEHDVQYILDNLRLEDMLELHTIYGNNYKEIAKNTIMSSEFPVLIGISKKNDIPVAMGGIWEVTPNDRGVAGVWLLSTDRVKHHQISLLRAIKHEIEKADEKYWLTYNFIYERNFRAKKWLKWLGYKFDNPRPRGVNVPNGFEYFYRVNKKGEI